jgi:hypothetical protein
MDSVLECRDNVLEYGDLKRVGRTTEYAIRKKGGGICRYIGSSNLGVCKGETQRNVLVRLQQKRFESFYLWRGKNVGGGSFLKMVCPSNSDHTLYSAVLLKLL